MLSSPLNLIKAQAFLDKLIAILFQSPFLVKHCLFLESPKSYISEEGGSPCPMDPNTMDVDSISSPPTMVNTQPGCK